MTSPKSILLHLDGSARCVERVRFARQLAETFAAEVDGLYCVTPSIWRYPLAVEGSAVVASDLAEDDDACRRKVQAAFLGASSGSPLMKFREMNGDAPWGFVQRALYADLLILGQRDEDDPAVGELPPDFLPSVLVESGKPALVLPYTGFSETTGRTVLVAWKETREAARAVSAALPWLQGAERVHVVAYGDDTRPSMERLRRYLTAQGVEATPHHGGPEQGHGGEALLSQAADLGADLLVMGCYGHSRAREWVLGGATRTILQSMTLPVLMAH